MISSVEQHDLFSGSGQDRKKIGVTQRVKLWDKVQALTTLARHFKLLEPSPRYIFNLEKDNLLTLAALGCDAEYDDIKDWDLR